MATILPRAGAGSVGGGGIRKVSLPDAGSVPAVRVASDPGVSIPDKGAVARGLEDVGTGLTNLSAGMKARDQRLAEADARLNARRESVERMRAGRELHDFGNDLFTEFESSRDFSRQEDAIEFGKMLNERAKELVESHQGSEESKLRLQEKLGSILEDISDRAGVAAVAAQDKMVEREFDETVNGLSARVRLGENPRVLIAEGMEFLNSEKDALRPGQEVAFQRALTARVWGAKIEDYMSKGAFDEAEEALAMPEVRAAVGEEAQRRAFNRIATARTEGKTRILSKGELAEMGFPPETIAAGLVVQSKADGTTNVVFNPPRDVDEKVREKRIKAVEAQRLRIGDSPEDAKDFATNVVDGNIRIEIVPGLGVAREVNEITGEVREVPLGNEGAASQPPQRTLFDLARSGAIAGIVPAAQEFLGGTVGQIPGVPVAEGVIKARQEMVESQNGLIRALSINPRFPVGEINRLRDEINIAPSMFDSQRALIARMKGIHNNLTIRLANEQAAAGDVNLPQATRAAAAQAAKDISNFLNRLGDPDTAPLPPEGIPDYSVRTGSTKNGGEVWTDPTGKQWVVE